VTPVIGTVLVAVHQVGIVVSSAVESAVALQFRRSEISTNLFRCRPEVVDRVLVVWQNGTIWDKDVVDADTLAGVGQVERVIQSGRRFGVGEAVKVPVGLHS